MPDREWLATSVRVGAALLVGIVITPYTAGTGFNWLHTTFGSMLLIIQLLTSARLAFSKPINWALRSLWLLELVCGVIFRQQYTSRPAHGYLIESQIAFQIAYGIIIIYTLRTMPFSSKNKAGYSISHEAEVNTK